ncbi:MAG: aminotransferase class III-fold pyridoxal phosphate-dependent enzyme [Roseiflexus sp.]
MSWSDLLAHHYHIHGTLTALPGEYDLNLLVTTDNATRYVLKVMRPDCDPTLVELQCAALEHIATEAPDLPVPRLVRTHTGAAYVAANNRLIWLITALPGEVYATFRPHTATLRTDLGRRAAQLDQALMTFTHPTLTRPLKWNLLYAEWALDRIAVITTAEIAHAFDNGIEFFSMFGGSTLSCVVGREVLRIIDEEGLTTNAAHIGSDLLAGLRELQRHYPIIGDVRGMGLFIGVELVSNRTTRAPATTAASYIKERLRAERILIGTEGPYDSVLKIRPPLTFDRTALTVLLERLDTVLAESFIARAVE